MRRVGSSKWLCFNVSDIGTVANVLLKLCVFLKHSIRCWLESLVVGTGVR